MRINYKGQPLRLRFLLGIQQVFRPRSFAFSHTSRSDLRRFGVVLFEAAGTRQDSEVRRVEEGVRQGWDPFGLSDQGDDLPLRVSVGLDVSRRDRQAGVPGEHLDIAQTAADLADFSRRAGNETAPRVSSKSRACPMLAFSSAACGLGRLTPRSSTRLSANPPHREITAKSSPIPGEPLPPSMQPNVSRRSRRADSTALAGKSA